MSFELSIGKALLWTGAYFFLMLAYTFLDVVLWRKFRPSFAAALNTGSIAVFSLAFVFILQKAGYPIAMFDNFSMKCLLLSLVCAAGFYLVFDMGIDPLLEKIFPQSEAGYQESVARVAAAPAAGFVRTCLLAPLVEEILMRGFVLRGLMPSYGLLTALLLSSALFALLHFNMVQTLSALLCGLVLGLLYLYTGSLLCCVLAHAGYNAVSFAQLRRGCAR